jgi:hypothetical protein
VPRHPVAVGRPPIRRRSESSARGPDGTLCVVRRRHARPSIACATAAATSALAASTAGGVPVSDHALFLMVSLRVAGLLNQRQGATGQPVGVGVRIVGPVVVDLVQADTDLVAAQPGLDVGVGGVCGRSGNSVIADRVPVGEVGGLDAHALQPWPPDVTRPTCIKQPAAVRPVMAATEAPDLEAAFRVMAEMTAGWVAPAPGLASRRP